MTATVRAIETRYAGYRFRSRLEARWAVFFQTLGTPWLYEPQGYEIPGHGLLGASSILCVTEDYAVLAAYRAARSARFEHGESGGS